MADLRYKVQVDTNEAQRSLGGLKQRVSGLGTAFKALAVGLVARELVQTIRTFQDLRQTLITIEGDAGRAAKSFDLIKQFTAQTTFQLDEVTKAFITFKNAGLQPTETFMKNIGNIAAGMGKRIDDVAQAVFNATTGEFEMLKQLGVKVKTEGDKLTVNFRGVAKTIDNDGKSIIKFLNDIGKVEFAGSIERQSKTLTGALSNLQDNFALALNEVGEGGLTTALTEVARSMGSVVGESQSLARTIGSVLGSAVKLVADNFKVLAIAVGVFVAQAAVSRIAAMVTIFIGLAKAIRTAVLAMVALNAAMGKNLVYKLAQGLVLVGGAVATYFGMSSTAVADTNKELKDLEKSLDNVNKKVPGGESFDSVIANMGQQDKGPDETTVGKMKKYTNSVNELVESYRFANRETLQYLDLSTKMLGVSEEDALLKRELNQLNAEYSRQLADLAKRKREAELLTDNDEKVNAINELTRAEQELTAAYEAQKPAIEAKVKAQTAELRSLRLQKFETDQFFDAQKQVRDLQHEMATVTMVGLEKKYADINKQARDSANAEIEAEARRRGVRKLSQEEELEYYRIAEERARSIREQAEENYKFNRRWSTGWNRAFKEYVENATNAAKAAERIFTKTVQGMEDLLVNFVKTGKFEWKSFVNSLAEEILRSNIRRLLAQIFSFGGGSKGGGLFGGFFADGGYLPAGKFGIVGERGPELISGPAQITPLNNGSLGGGSTVVNYNINAVDAPSFQAMIARDPSFIYAVTEQGRKSLPMTTR